MRNAARTLAVGLGLTIAGAAHAQPQATAPQTGLRFEVSFPATVQSAPLDGRLLLMLSSRSDPEPHFQVNVFMAESPPMFGVDVNGLGPGQVAVIDGRTYGYPVMSIAQLPAGDYYAQALLNVYTTFRRADGHVVKMHMDQGEGQNWQRSPGNLLSEVQRIGIDPAKGATVKISLSRKIPPIDPPRDTRYIKHVTIKSDALSKFWGRDMYVGAAVLLPEGWDTHPNARYPVAYWQGHFAPTIRGFRETPPPAGSPAADSAAYRFYQLWTSRDFPRMIVVQQQDANPYFDDSYAVNSVNVGPYGDALWKELMPYLEQNFRAIDQPWGRVLYGGSTGGWRALGVQVFYPDLFAGTWAFCPDPVDFRGYRSVNLYENQNAYYQEFDGGRRVPRPGYRTILGELLSTFEQRNLIEHVVGPNGRSGGQHDIWPAVFGPVGSDGFYKPPYDKVTGEVDRSVVQYWRDHYDLRYILERDWATLGPKLRGKIHVTMGDMDNGYLTISAYHLDNFLRNAKNPPAEAQFIHERLRGHCYSAVPEGKSVNEYWLPIMADYIVKHAPPGVDLTGWKY